MDIVDWTVRARWAATRHRSLQYRSGRPPRAADRAGSGSPQRAHAPTFVGAAGCVSAVADSGAAGVSAGWSRCMGGPPRPGQAKLTTRPGSSSVTGPVRAAGASGGQAEIINAANAAESPRLTAASTTAGRQQLGAGPPLRIGRVGAPQIHVVLSRWPALTDVRQPPHRSRHRRHPAGEPHLRHRQWRTNPVPVQRGRPIQQLHPARAVHPPDPPRRRLPLHHHRNPGQLRQHRRPPCSPPPTGNEPTCASQLTLRNLGGIGTEPSSLKARARGSSARRHIVTNSVRHMGTEQAHW